MKRVKRVGYASNKPFSINPNEERSWFSINQEIKRFFGDKVIRTYGLIKEDMKNDGRIYQDDDHLSPYYLRDNAVWLDPIFEKHFGDKARK